MKKLLITILSISLLLSVAGCGNSAELEQLKKENEELRALIASPTPIPTQNNSPLTGETVTEVQEFRWTEEFINATEYHNDLLVTNRYDSTLQFAVETLFYDQNNNVLGKDTAYTPAVMSGQSTFVDISLQDVEFAKAEYSITPSKASKPAIDISKMNYALSSGGNDVKLVLSITNNDTIDYYNTGVHIVFYNGEEIQSIKGVGASNSEYVLAAGATEYKDFSYKDLYTDYKIYPYGTVKP